MKKDDKGKMERGILKVGDVMTPEVITEDDDASVIKLSKGMDVSGIGNVVITHKKMNP
jgi:predicted transcriptional regulator